MDLKRKIELMKKYDFGGFGNKVGTIDLCITILVLTNDPTKSESRIETLKKTYDWLKSKYDGIDFTEVETKTDDSDKEDFATLFMTKEALPALEVALDNLIVFLRENNYRVSYDDKVWWAAETALQRIKNADNHKGIEYRRRIENLEYQLQSESAQ